ncbi:type II toxin-antitoxin system PemK/MazF family toxin [Phaeobacter inhibens]|uniref:type II toxin-antitoxin system PemK/MazF family toxin n=1 Tax=Phaeobacter inhibens TaxID=221822 RepID=UPI0021A5CAEA|nr:type II toxin-antitoxin system PemK/MazF family toxin [Phaeobacter inhibens]UWS03115.1 type II toxin-antitoxin system PemK/MazF family toxin [Phaeobacter inhibens]
MPIKYDVNQRTVLLCDYSKGGFKPPEMVKRRPVIAVSPRLRHRRGLLTVVPLSTTPPDRIAPHHCQIELPYSLPHFPETTCWVKADMLATVGFERLDLFRTERDQTGKRKYLTPRVSEDEFEKVRACLRVALDI